MAQLPTNEKDRVYPIGYSGSSAAQPINRPLVDVDLMRMEREETEEEEDTLLCQRVAPLINRQLTVVVPASNGDHWNYNCDRFCVN